MWESKDRVERVGEIIQEIIGLLTGFGHQFIT